MFKKKQYIHVLHSLLDCFLLGSTIIVQTGCDMIEYHPYDLNIEGETNINERNIQSIEASTAGKQSISFALISDTQRWYDETEDFVKAINQPILDCYSLKTYESLLLCTKTVFLD